MRADRPGVALLLACLLAGCGGSGGGGAAAPAPVAAPAALTAEEVRRILAQAVAEAGARGARAHVAVVDRVGNVLAVHSMPGAPDSILITSGATASGGLETRRPIVPATLAAISKALTGAYLSSTGNAFSTRTAGQIVQQHFNPGESRQPAGPLYGVQFSQLACSDVMRRAEQGSAGPQRAPLGLAADPGGLPLYKDGALVGGVGIEADGRYGIDADILDVDEQDEERVAVAASHGFAAPADIRAERITADGRTLRFVDGESLATDPARAAPLPPDAASRPVAGYHDGIVRAGTAYGAAASGIALAGSPFAARGGWVVTDGAGTNRFAPRASADAALTAAEVQATLEEALALATRARAQIRRPLGSMAQVSIAVVDAAGDILGLVRTPDAPMFGIDVAVQKARSAMFLSHPAAAAELAGAPAARYLDTGEATAPGEYVARARAFLAMPNALTGTTAFTSRALGNLHRPFYPDGIDGAPAGPFSTPIETWSPFNIGLQLDLANNQLVRGVLGDPSVGCAGRAAADAPAGSDDAGIARVRNGLQIFPGGVPIYRGERLVGAIGVSGDGVDQDDMIAFLGLHNAGARLVTGVGNAPAAMRADRLTPQGTRLRYVQCPQSPFLDSSEQDACAGK